MKNKNKFDFIKEIIFYILGIILIASFVYLYWTRFVSEKTIPPIIGKFSHNGKYMLLFLSNAGIFILFILFLPYRKKMEWRSKGAFSAFIIALFAEMFGISLLAYILTPLFGRFPFEKLGIPYINQLRHYFIFGWPGMFIGAYLTLIGLLLVFIGWIQVHKVEGLVTTGLYKYIRHPQYTGLFLIITGWIFHWLNLLMLLMYPLLLVMYYRLAKKEEEELVDEFGEKYKKVQKKY